MGIKVLGVILLTASLALPAKAGIGSGWTFVGDQNNLRFWCKPGKRGEVRFKVENMLGYPMQVKFRLNGVARTKCFIRTLGARESDSSIVCSQSGRARPNPRVDKVYLDPRDILGLM